MVATPKPSGCEQYRPLLYQYSWNVDVALAIMEAESHCNPLADNTGTNSDGSNDKGLMQINSIHEDLISDTDRLDPTKNIATAYTIYQGAKDKFTPWSSYNNQSYAQYLNN